MNEHPWPLITGAVSFEPVLSNHPEDPWPVVVKLTRGGEERQYVPESELSLSLAREQRLRFLVGEIRTLLEGGDDPDVAVVLARNIVYDALSSVPNGEGR